MKTCIKCKEEKEDLFFDYNSGHKRKEGQLKNICKPCAIGSLRQHRQKMRKLVNRWKVIKGCSSCGFKGKHFQLDLDHIDPSTKHRSGSHRAFEPNWKKERIKNELKKCVILCANCHRLKTFENSDHLSVCDSPAHDENYI